MYLHRLSSARVVNSFNLWFLNCYSLKTINKIKNNYTIITTLLLLLHLMNWMTQSVRLVCCKYLHVCLRMHKWFVYTCIHASVSTVTQGWKLSVRCFISKPPPLPPVRSAKCDNFSTQMTPDIIIDSHWHVWPTKASWEGAEEELSICISVVETKRKVFHYCWKSPWLLFIWTKHPEDVWSRRV